MSLAARRTNSCSGALSARAARVLMPTRPLARSVPAGDDRQPGARLERERYLRADAAEPLDGDRLQIGAPRPRRWNVRFIIRDPHGVNDQIRHLIRHFVVLKRSGNDLGHALPGLSHAVKRYISRGERQVYIRPRVVWLAIVYA